MLLQKLKTHKEWEAGTRDIEEGAKGDPKSMNGVKPGTRGNNVGAMGAKGETASAIAGVNGAKVGTKSEKAGVKVHGLVKRAQRQV